jgi:hypothetical protein
MGKLRVRASQDSGEDDIEQAVAALRAIRNPLMRYWLVQLIDLIAQTCTEPVPDDVLKSHLMQAPTTKRQ